MKVFRAISVSVCLILFCVAANALDFTGKDGTAYKNAMVLKVMWDGIVISYVDSDGFDCVKHIKTGQLPLNIVKEYNLNPQTSAVFNAQLAPIHAEPTKMERTITPVGVSSGLASFVNDTQVNSSYLTPAQKTQFNKLDSMVKGLPDQNLLTGLIKINENHLNDINEGIHDIDDPSDIRPEDRN